MNTKLNLKLMTTPICLIAGMMTVSCTDSNYDLGNLDKKIAIGSEQGLALPGNNSTKELQLKDIFTLPDSGVIKIDENTGEYVFSESATPDATTIFIEKVEMSKEGETDDDYDYDFADIFDDIFGSRSAIEATNQNDGMREIKHFSFNSATPKSIKMLKKAVFNSTIDISLDFSNDLQNYINELKKLEVNVPTYFDIDVEVAQVKTDLSETIYPKDVFDPSTNTMTLTSFASNQKGVHVLISLKGIIFNTDNERDKSYGYFLTMDEKNISLEGGVNMQAVYEHPTSSRSAVRNAPSKDLSIACKTQVGDITFEGGEGHFKPEIDLKDGFGHFTIGELPEFLDDERVKLKVKKPRITLQISNDINLDGIISDPKIIAKMKNGTTKSVSIMPFIINRHETSATTKSTTTTVVIVNDEASQDDIDTDFDYCSTTTSDENLTELLEEITDIESISFECSATTDEDQEGEVDLGYEYTIQPEFEFYAPLEFEAGSTIVYKDTISNWHDDLKDLKLTHDSYVEITANVVNQLPMNLIIDVIPVERMDDGSLSKLNADQFAVIIWTGDDESLSQNLVFAGTTSTPRTTKLHILLKQQNDNAFSRIDGIIYRANGVSPQDGLSEAIKEISQLKLENIGVFLKGKLVTDLDD